MNTGGRFILPYCLFGAARMGIGASVVVYLLSQGLSFSEIATLKIIQAIVIFFGEIPTGLLADSLGRKASSLVAMLCGMICFALFALGDSFFAYSLAEVFNALTICFWSGAYSSLVVDSFKDESNERGFLEVLFSKMNMFSALSIMFSGLIGGILYEISPKLPFLWSSLLMAAAFLALNFLVKERKAFRQKENRCGVVGFFRKQNLVLGQTILFVKREKKFTYIFLVQILIQFAIQPLLHYWQPYVTDLASDSAGKILGIAFFLYVGADLVFNFLSNRFLKRYPQLSAHFVVTELVVLSLILGVMIFSGGLWLGLAALVASQGLMSNARSLIEANIHRQVDSAIRASFFSSLSFVSRLGMFVSLAILSQWVDYLNDFATLFFLSVVGFIFVIPIYILWLRAAQKHEPEMILKERAA